MIIIINNNNNENHHEKGHFESIHGTMQGDQGIPILPRLKWALKLIPYLHGEWQIKINNLQKNNGSIQ